MLNGFIFPKFWKIAENRVFCECCVFLIVCIFVVAEILLMSLAVLPLNLTSNFQLLRLLHCAFWTQSLCTSCSLVWRAESRTHWAVLILMSIPVGFVELWQHWMCLFLFMFGRLLKAWARFFDQWLLEAVLSLVKEVCVVENAPAWCSLGHER